MTDRELMQQALQALEFLSCGDEIDEALIVALRQRLEQPEQEPVAYINVEKRRLEFAEPMVWHTPTVVKLERIPLYTHQRTWVGLTDEEFIYIVDSVYHQGHGFVAYYRAIEAKLKEKNK